MPTESNKPVIFISYAHADEPDYPAQGEVRWLSFVCRYLQPAIKDGIFDLWVDRQMMGGADWRQEIELKLRACDIFILLVSANSMASDYIVDEEIAVIRERQAKGDAVYFYPLLLTPTPDVGLEKVRDKNLRPRDGRPFSGFSFHDRMQCMVEAANEIARIARKIVERKRALQLDAPFLLPAYVHISRLPETAYERLVGREIELKRLDDAWVDANTNIISLVAEGGSGKSALVNEWLKRLQADNYRGAQAVLGWSFYSQGSKERATSSEEFLNWMLDKLNIKLQISDAGSKGEMIAERMMERRVLLMLDGVEPLQHHLDTQFGRLKDPGLRALLRRFAATPPAQTHGLIVLTSRLPVRDVARWQDRAAPVVDVERLSEDAGAALLRDNSVWGTDKELRAAARDFGDHPLALGLLASFLRETQSGDVRRRDHIRAFFAEPDSSQYDHARRVMESYEKEWLAGQPMLHAIMSVVGLFDRPASGDCLEVLRAEPAIEGLTEELVKLDYGDWARSVCRLREVSLLSPIDPAAPDALDAHPLVREWFGERLRQTNEAAWRCAHGRLYEHLRDTTEEGKTPALKDLAPLYQAIGHGCRAGRHQEVLNVIYRKRLGIGIELGAVGSDLAVISWFFDVPYERPLATLMLTDQAWVLSSAAFSLHAQGRFTEALPAWRAGLRIWETMKRWREAALGASNLSRSELFVGDVASAIASAEKSVMYADRTGNKSSMLGYRTTQADALYASGRREEAELLFAEVERRQMEEQPSFLISIEGYRYCDLLLAKGEWGAARNRSTRAIEVAGKTNSTLGKALDTLVIGRSNFGLALEHVVVPPWGAVEGVRTELNEAVDGLRASGQSIYLPRGLLPRAAFRRSIGDWYGAARDLDEIEEIAEPGQMKLILCDLALERARLVLARRIGWAPLSEALEKDNPANHAISNPEGIAEQNGEAEKNLSIAANMIATCGYHRRDEELSELQAVLRGGRKFAELPPRV